MEPKVLSPEAQHAIETVRFALYSGEDNMTAGELQDCIRKIYGDKVNQEIKDYFTPIPMKPVP